METAYKDKSEVTREFYRKQGEKRERERIVELLKAEICPNPGYVPCCSRNCYMFKVAVELILGMSVHKMFLKQKLSEDTTNANL